MRSTNLTVRVDDHVLLWARTRALFARTSVAALVQAFLEEYAAVPEKFRRGEPPPWTDAANAAGAFAEVVAPREAGRLAAGAAAGSAARRRSPQSPPSPPQ
jgi:hypothetical protein